MNYKFSDLVDIQKLQDLMEAFFVATGIPSGIVDIEGNILVANGWKELCVKFHRTNLNTNLLCMESDKFLEKNIKNHLQSKGPFIRYKCSNGLMDAAAPIVIDGIHVASIYRGQFLLEKPDVEYFRKQANMFGFNELEYLEALKEIPVVTEEEIKSVMVYFRQLAELLAEMGLGKLKLLEANAQLQESELRLKTIIENTPSVAVLSYDKKGNIFFCNSAAEKLFGLTRQEMKSNNLDKKFLNEKSKKLFIEMLLRCDKNNSSIGPIELKIVNNFGEEKIIYYSIFPIHVQSNKKEFICMSIDITEKKLVEKEIARIDKLTTVGQMAAGIAHEIRNPMTSVRGYLQLFSGKNDFAKYKEHFELMIQELDRANSIITEFLSLAKNKAVKLEVKNLNSIILALSPLIEANTQLFNIKLKLELGEIHDILLDEQEIRQLILNIAQNGIEAMILGGCLTIKTYIEDGDIILVIEDQGQGIPPEVMDKLGTPFITTKENGTGLGLSISYNIAARHKAKILVESSQKGTIFLIRFKTSKEQTIKN